MTIAHGYTIEALCDVGLCVPALREYSGSFYGHSRHNAFQAMKAAGWVVLDDHRCKCPYCAKETDR